MIEAHVEKLNDVSTNNMNYIVKHGTKQAIFKLKDRRNTFGDIKNNIAEYFGLPKAYIFLENVKGEILLSKHKVIDELFPLQSSKICGEEPVINVTFQKNMSTLDYILGDPLEKNAKLKESEGLEKKKKHEAELKRKNEEQEKKIKEIAYLTKKATIENENKAFRFGLISTAFFLIFVIQHINLCLEQYDVGNLNKMNRAVTLATLP